MLYHRRNHQGVLGTRTVQTGLLTYIHTYTMNIRLIFFPTSHTSAVTKVPDIHQTDFSAPQSQACHSQAQCLSKYSRLTQSCTSADSPASSGQAVGIAAGYARITSSLSRTGGNRILSAVWSSPSQVYPPVDERHIATVICLSNES